MTVQITWLGHAAFLIEAPEGNTLIDPFITQNPRATITLEDLPKIHMILVTHAHGDHLGDTKAIAEKHDALVVSTVEVVNWLKRQGVRRVHGQQAGGAYTHPAGRVKLTPAFHGSSLPDGSYGGQPVGVILEVLGKKIYHAGDTSIFGDMELLAPMQIDLALLPIGDNFTMGPEDAILACSLIRPKMVLPMHYGTWPVINVSPELFIKGAERSGHRVVKYSVNESFQL